MARQFNIGRGSEALMNDENHEIYRSIKFLNDIPSSTAVGPAPNVDIGEEIKNGALWLDNISNENNADLKFFKNGSWNLAFNDRFKITGHLLDEEEPFAPIPSQLWIDPAGVLKYYDKGEFRPIKATMADIGTVNPLGFEDFIIIDQLDTAGSTVVDNFTKYIFAKTPIVEWNSERGYAKNEGAVKGNHIYICRKAYDAGENILITNLSYWIRLEFLNQFLVPNANVVRAYINGNFIHQHVRMTVTENNQEVLDPNEKGWKKESDVCISFPTEMIEGKNVNAVHVNPTRIHDITKKFIAIDKNNPIIEVKEDGTEYYGMSGGIGKLLIKKNQESKSDYVSVTSRNVNCIKLTPKTAEMYDFIYTITYTFAKSKVKESGVLHKKKLKLKDENYIWIDKVDPEKIMVFAQGLYYEKDNNNYRYDQATGYLYILEDLQDYDNIVKKFDFSVLYFPHTHHGRVTAVQYDDNNYINGIGYRISVNHNFRDKKSLAFLKGVQLSEADGDINYVDSDPTAIYIPSLTRENVEDSGEIYWSIAETVEYDKDGRESFNMFRGVVKAQASETKNNGIVRVSRDKENVGPNEVYVATDEMPILFIDGVLVFQKEIEMHEDHFYIYGLKEGQNVLVLADTNSSNDFIGMSGELSPFNSDRVLFEDSVSYATIPTQYNDSAVVFLGNGVLSDASSVTTSIKPTGHGCHGEIRHYIDYSFDKWVMYNGDTGEWIDIPGDLTVEDSSGANIPYIELLDKTSRGYSSTRSSISFLQNLGEEYCTYYAYKYSDSIEKKLLFGYAKVDGVNGVNNDNPAEGEGGPFRTAFKHYYTPGKNELTVYLNGIRQILLSKNDPGFELSKNRECKADRNGEFVLAIDDKSVIGKPLPHEEGYHVYHLKKSLEETRSLVLNREITQEEIKEYTDQGFKVEKASSPTKNSIMYVIERCEGTENKACERVVLTYKNSLSEVGAYVSNTYDTGGLILTRGNVRVFLNGIRQPFGAYQTRRSIKEHVRGMLQSYRIIDSKTIQFEDPLIGGMGGNEGTADDPRFPIGNITWPDGITRKEYHKVIDSIVIEVRRDLKIREITIPILDNTGIFTARDGIPADMFKTKDKIQIWINGHIYGKEYILGNEEIELKNSEIMQYMGLSDDDVITFEWR